VKKSAVPGNDGFGPLQKRVDEAQAVDGEAVLHVFGVKLAAAERQRRRR
jgi:hypothetical protein